MLEATLAPNGQMVPPSVLSTVLPSTFLWQNLILCPHRGGPHFCPKTLTELSDKPPYIYSPSDGDVCLSDRHMSGSDRYLSQTDMSLSQTETCLSQTQMCLSQTQMCQLPCPKSIKIVMNGVPVARHGPILREKEATASGRFFKHLPGPPRPGFGQKTVSKIRNPQNLFSPLNIYLC